MVVSDTVEIRKTFLFILKYANSLAILCTLWVGDNKEEILRPYGMPTTTTSIYQYFNLLYPGDFNPGVKNYSNGDRYHIQDSVCYEMNQWGMITSQ